MASPIRNLLVSLRASSNLESRFIGRSGTLPGLLLGALVFALFLPTVRYGFVNIDDPIYVSANFHVQPGLTKQGLCWAFTSFYAANWHPITWVSHMLDCQFFGLNPAGHHFTNTLIHAANTVLLFCLLRALTGHFWRSLAVAAVFGLHPLRAESVAWISERKDVLSTFFFMLTLWAYCSYARGGTSQTPTKRWLNYALSLILFALGLMSKAMLVTVPFILLLLDYWPLRRFQGAKESSQEIGSPAPISLFCIAAEKIPFFLLSLGSSVVTFIAQKHGGTVEATTGVRFLFRLENAAVAYACYLGKLFFPMKLAVFYPQPSHWGLGIVVFAYILVLGFSALAFVERRSRPYWFVGWFWFVGTLIPVIGLIQVGTQAMADRYTYIPCVGILIMIVWTLSDGTGPLARARPWMPVFCIAVVLLCLPLTSYQLSFWRNSEILFRHALQVTENNYVAYDSMGDVLSEKGLVEEAKKLYLKALQLSPGYWAAHNNLGLILVGQGKLDDAITHYQEALKESPGNPDILTNLGNALYLKGNLSNAISCFQQALAREPSHPEAHENMGRVLFMQGKVDEAIAHFRVALQIRPDYALAHHNLAIALLTQHHPQEAVEHLFTAIRLQPDLLAARSLLGTTLASEGHLKEAEAQFRAVLKLESQDRYALNNLGAVLSDQGSFDEAVNVLRESTRLYPADADGHLFLGRALANQEKFAAAIEELRTAASLRPGDMRIQKTLQAVIAKTNEH